jgi:ATP-binding cassette subfamily B protein RaxB
MGAIGDSLRRLFERTSAAREWSSEYLDFGFSPRLPIVLQSEATECGLACLAMITHYYGLPIGIVDLRREFAVSLKGANVAQLIDVAGQLRLSTRAVRLDLEELPALRLPAVLHWNFNHFVVLKRVGRGEVTILDPARGQRNVPHSELSKSFTGVALELWPRPDFMVGETRNRNQLSVRSVVGKTVGLVPLIVQTIAIALGIEALSLILPLMTKWVIDYVIVAEDTALLRTCVIGFGLVMLVQQALTAMRGWVMMYLTSTLNFQWQGNVLAHLLKLPVEYFQKRHLGDIVSRFGSVEQIQNTISTAFMSATLDGLMSVATLAMMLVYSAKMSFISVGAIGLYFVLRAATFGTLRGNTQMRIVFSAKQQTHFLETMRGVRAIKLFQREDLRRLGWLTLLARQTNASLKTQRAQLVFQTANGVLFGAERILVLWLGASMVIDHAFTVGALMAFVSYKEQFASRVVSLADRLFEFRMLRLHTERVSDIVMTQPEVTRRRGAGNVSPEEDITITARDVAFRYGANEPLVLKGVSLSVPPGKSLAITGASGCGKSTLANLLIGLTRPISGKITIGDIDIRHLDKSMLRGLICAVTQDDTLFAGSIAENIVFFDERPDWDRMQKCARLAVIHDDISAMPMGYSTLVGDMGSVLSGGQKQRILLARALYGGAKILVLDEATSHLDLRCEARLLANLRDLGLTRIIVAHRPETYSSADAILSLETVSLRSENQDRERRQPQVQRVEFPVGRQG